MMNRFMMKRFDVLKKRLPWLTDTPLVFSTNPPNETFSSKNCSHSSPRIPAQAGVEDKTIRIILAVKKKTLWHFFTMRSSSSCQLCFCVWFVVLVWNCCLLCCGSRPQSNSFIVVCQVLFLHLFCRLFY